MIYLSKPTHVIFSTLVCGLSLLVATSAFAFNRLDAIEAVQSVRVNSTDVQLAVWLNDMKDSENPGVNVGDSVTFSIESGIPSHFLLTLIDAKGETTLFLGNADQPRSTRLDFPVRGSLERLIQSDPLGEQTLFVFASSAAFDLQEFGVTSAERIVTLAKDTNVLQKIASRLNRHGGSSTLARSARYSYAVDSPLNKISTRGIRRKIDNVMVAARPPVNDKKPGLSTQQNKFDTVSSGANSVSLDIKFRTNSTELERAGIAQLEVLGSELINRLEANKLPVIYLEGHTDDTGSSDYNMWLSSKRAQSARSYLIDNFGIPASNIEATGMGESSPLIANTDRASRAVNRRVELRAMQEAVSQ